MALILQRGGDWISVSSRESKENIRHLSFDDALDTVNQLQPVTFNYKIEKNDTNVGFIAEDVPDLVATEDRKGLSSMNIVATLTRVVQYQQGELEKQKKLIEEQREILKQQQKSIDQLKDQINM